MRIRPCIDIHNGKVKQIVGGSLRDAKESPQLPERAVSTARENFVSSHDADYYASIYREKNLPGGHIILLNPGSDAAAYEADRAQALRALAAYPGGMQIGGGITPETAGGFLDAGASHVIVTSYVFRDGKLDEERLNEMLRAVGREHLVLDLSCRRAAPAKDSSPRYMVVTDRWQKMTDLAVCSGTLEKLSDCCDEFLIHAADVEGRRAGIEQDVVRILGAWQRKRLADGLAPFPVTYAGGIHALSDIPLMRQLSGDTVDATVGSALDLFGGDLSLEELVSLT